MVGDSGTDVATARAADVPVVAVDFGYTEMPVVELGADRVIGRFRGPSRSRFRALGAGQIADG